MYLIAIGWMYVALMMSVAEATNTNGSILGAIFTFLMYGILPTGLIVYILSTPQRRRNREAREAREALQARDAPGEREAREPQDAPSAHEPGQSPKPDGGRPQELR